MSSGESQEKKNARMVMRDAKRLCEELRDKEFAFITKVELSVVIYNLVNEIHRKNELIDKLKGVQE